MSGSTAHMRLYIQGIIVLVYDMSKNLYAQRSPDLSAVQSVLRRFYWALESRANFRFAAMVAPSLDSEKAGWSTVDDDNMYDAEHADNDDE